MLTKAVRTINVLFFNDPSSMSLVVSYVRDMFNPSVAFQVPTFDMPDDVSSTISTAKLVRNP